MVTETQYEQSLAARVRELSAKRLRRLLVTSAGPAEGKSSVVAALGRALAGSGPESVLLVDANPNHSDLHRVFGLSPELGLSNLLESVYFFDVSRENPNQFGLGDWLEILRAQMKTGELVVTEGERRYSVRLARGTISSISDGESRGESSLGELLVRRGKISAAQRNGALRIHEESGRPLGEVLLMLDYATEADLSQALLDQADRALVELIALRQPSCRFRETAESYRPVTGGRAPATPQSQAIDELVTGGLRDYLKSPFLSSQLPVYVSDTALPSLKVLPAGSRPSDLNSPPRIRALGLLLERLGRIFDIILVDTAEVGLASPANALAGLVDGTVLVVKADQEDVASIRHAADDLRRGGGQVLGVVLNQAGRA